jgi:hypothetical protein
MTATQKLQTLLNKAGKSARRKASRKKLPIAISENGEIKLIYPDKKVKVIRKAQKHRKAS